jgi:hypothetical protein
MATAIRCNGCRSSARTDECFLYKPLIMTHESQYISTMEPAAVVIKLDVLFPGLEHQGIRYVFHVCALRDLFSQTRLIDFEGIETVKDFANYTDTELDVMADRNSKGMLVVTRVQMKNSRPLRIGSARRPVRTLSATSIS